MSLNHSPAVVTNGLQFYYDAANNKNVTTGSNLLTSTDLSNLTYWGSSAGMTVTANAAVAPDGTMTAYSVALTGAVSCWGSTLTTATIGTGQQFSSIYAKAFPTGTNYFTFNSYYAGDTEVNIDFTLTGNGTTSAPTQSIIKNVGNGWYLCTIFTPARVNAGTNFGFRVWPAGRAILTGGTYFWSPTLKNSFTDLVGNNTLTPNVLAYDSSNNGGISFNGTSSYLIAPENSALNTQTPSVEVWVKTNSITQNGVWFVKGNINSQYSLFQEGGYIIWRQNNSTTITSLTAPVSNINTSQYAHIVATYTSGARKIYINGVLVASDTAAFTIPNAGNGVSIGVSGGYSLGSPIYYYNGNIAIVKVYNKALSASDVSQNFNALRGRFGI
jgi:Concanavalin A-like lectin/glucanases superfamily